MRHFSLAFALAIVFASGRVLGGETGEKAEGTQICKLTFTPLPSIAMVLSNKDIWHYSDKTAPTMIWVHKGVVLTTREGEPKTSEALKIELGDKNASVLYDGSKFLLKEGEKPRVLKKSGYGFASETLSLGENRKYLLAFPRVYMGSRTGISLYYRSGSVQKGKLDKCDIALYDDNFDGAYTAKDDTILVGDGCVFAPISTLIGTPDAVYKIEEISPDGSQLSYSKYVGEMGKISFKFAGKGMTGQFAFASKDADLSFVIGMGQESVTVAPGEYELLYGLVFSKKKPVAGAVPGKIAPVKVTGGSTTQVVLGGPFKLVFDPVIQNNQLVIRPQTIRVVGKCREEYVSFDHSTHPRVLVDGKLGQEWGFG